MHLVILKIQKNYYKNCLSIPIYPSLKDEEQDFIIDKILTYVNR